MSTPKTEKKIVLFAVLDWGLGHATRSIPLIHRLLSQNCGVILGGCGPGLLLLKEEFPQLRHVELPSYAFPYPARGWMMPFAIMRALPGFLRAIRREHNILRSMATNGEIQGVISDNRYGLYLPGLPSRLIIHQLRIKMPGWLLPAGWLLNRLHTALLDRFDALWVPDTPTHELAGELSIPLNTRSRVNYLGPLSRFNASNTAAQDKQYELCVLLSGPEPQRSMLEDAVIAQLSDSSARIGLIRGLPGAAQDKEFPANFSVWNHLPASEMQNVPALSKVVLCRSGYSTLMDLSRIGGKAVLVPTPGQTEQEYLARIWSRNGRAIAMNQDNLDLRSIVDGTIPVPALPVYQENPAIDAAIREFLHDEFPP